MTEQEVQDYKEQVFAQSSTQSQTQTPAPTVDTITPVVDVIVPDKLVEQAAETPIVDKVPTQAADIPVKTEVAVDYLKELGFETIDAAKESIKELKAKAETPAEIKFANEQSKTLYELIAAGKNSEVRQFLDTQDKLSKVADMSAEAALKLHIEQTNKHYTSDDVKDVFEEKYSKPSAPKQGDDELDDAFAERTAKYQETVAKIDRRIERDAKEAKDALSQLATKLELPNIDKPVDVDYEKWKTSSQTQAAAIEAEKTAYTKFTPQDIKLDFKYEDKARKLAFDINFSPDEKSFAKSVEEAGDLTKFFGKFYGEDGSPQREKFLKAIYAADNLDKIVAESVKQAVNETTKDFLAKAKNVGNEIRRDYNTPLEKSQIQTLKEQVFG